MQVPKEPLQSVSVYIQDGRGVTTKEDGSYVYATNNTAIKTIKFSYVGYKTLSKNIAPNQEQASRCGDGTCRRQKYGNGKVEEGQVF
jgi:hypothetical protein